MSSDKRQYKAPAALDSQQVARVCSGRYAFVMHCKV